MQDYMKVVYKVHSKLEEESGMCLRNHLFYRVALSHATLSTVQRALMMSRHDDWSKRDGLCCLTQLHNSQTFILPLQTDGLQ